MIVELGAFIQKTTIKKSRILLEVKYLEIYGRTFRGKCTVLYGPMYAEEKLFSKMEFVI